MDTRRPVRDEAAQLGELGVGLWSVVHWEGGPDGEVIAYGLATEADALALVEPLLAKASRSECWEIRRADRPVWTSERDGVLERVDELPEWATRSSGRPE